MNTKEYLEICRGQYELFEVCQYLTLVYIVITCWLIKNIDDNKHVRLVSIVTSFIIAINIMYEYLCLAYVSEYFISTFALQLVCLFACILTFIAHKK